MLEYPFLLGLLRRNFCCCSIPLWRALQFGFLFRSTQSLLGCVQELLGRGTLRVLDMRLCSFIATFLMSSFLQFPFRIRTVLNSKLSFRCKDGHGLPVYLPFLMLSPPFFFPISILLLLLFGLAFAFCYIADTFFPFSSKSSRSSKCLLLPRSASTEARCVSHFAVTPYCLFAVGYPLTLSCSIPIVVCCVCLQRRSPSVWRLSKLLYESKGEKKRKAEHLRTRCGGCLSFT